MPLRIVNSPIQLFRDGKFFEPVVGSTVDLTTDELDSLNKANPDALGLIVTDDKPLVARKKGD